MGRNVMNLNDITGNAVKKDIIDTVNQMYKKKLLPERSRKLIYDNISQMATQYIIQTFKEWSCLECAFTINAPNLLRIHHQKIHADKKEIGENEILRMEYKLY